MRLADSSWARWAGQAGLLVLAFLVDFLGVDNGQLRFGGALPNQMIMLLGLPFFAVLLWRWRYPRVVFAVVLAYTVVAALAVPAYEPFAGLTIMLYTVSRRVATGQAIGWMLATTPAIAINAVNAGAGSGYQAGDYALAALLWTTIFGIAWVASRYSYRTARMVELRDAAHAAEAALAVQEERLRLARELHDIVAHTVSAMVVQAAGARTVSGRADVTEGALRAIEESGVRAMRELRRLLGLLRSEVTIEAPAAGTASLADLDDLVETTRACGVTVEVSSTGGPTDLDPSVDHAAYRIMGECLANVIKHGGRGASVWLRLGWRPELLHINVRSRRGADPTGPAVQSGLGLQGMLERIAALGGSLRYGETAAGDFVVDAQLPLRKPVAAGSDAADSTGAR
ncbi:MAG: histidine kinase [Microlunatus sp.]|nr:histidine kinase [Microlunatus sp.]MDN5769694.1 histidine kinase [Microlunatus sp.]